MYRYLFLLSAILFLLSCKLEFKDQDRKETKKTTINDPTQDWVSFDYIMAKTKELEEQIGFRVERSISIGMIGGNKKDFEAKLAKVEKVFKDHPDLKEQGFRSIALSTNFSISRTMVIGSISQSTTDRDNGMTVYIDINKSAEEITSYLYSTKSKIEILKYTDEKEKAFEKDYNTKIAVDYRFQDKNQVDEFFNMLEDVVSDNRKIRDYLKDKFVIIGEEDRFSKYFPNVKDIFINVKFTKNELEDYLDKVSSEEKK